MPRAGAPPKTCTTECQLAALWALVVGGLILAVLAMSFGLTAFISPDIVGVKDRLGVVEDKLQIVENGHAAVAANQVNINTTLYQVLNHTNNIVNVAWPSLFSPQCLNSSCNAFRGV
jgi:hypothetical protein